MDKELLDKLDRLNWLLGAIESHSSIFLRLYAEQCGKKVEWYNPPKEAVPFTKQDGDSAAFETVKIYFPLEARNKD